MRKRFLTTLAFLGAPLLFAACAIAGSTGADRMRRAFIVLLLIASIGCSGGSPVTPSPVAEIGATFTNVAVALEAPVRRVTHHTTGWTFNLLNDSAYNERLNKYRLVEFRTPETGDEGTHWYVQFRSIETYEGQPHERGVFVEVDPNRLRHINGFWANVRYVVQARPYAKNFNHFYSIGYNLTEVGGLTTPRCPSGTQPRDGIHGGDTTATSAISGATATGCGSTRTGCGPRPRSAARESQGEARLGSLATRFGPADINGRTSDPPEASSPEVCSFRLPLTDATR